MSAIASALSRFFPKKGARLLALGLDASGRTSWLYSVVMPGEQITTIPTIGFNVETFESDGVSFTVWDVGGCDKIRPLWRHYFVNTDGILFLVDANDRDRMDEVRKELATLLAEEELRGAFCLVIANKQDLPGALSPAAVAERLELATVLAGRHWLCVGGEVHNTELTKAQVAWLVSAVKHKGPSAGPAPVVSTGVAGAGARAPTAGAAGSAPAPAAPSPLESWLEVVDEPDDEFLEKLEGWSLSSWDHRTHLRLAFLYLQRHGRREGLRRISASIREFISHSPLMQRKSGTTYHETMTYFWSHMVHFAMASTKPPGGAPLDFKLLLLLNPQLSNGGLFLHYYSKKLMLMTPESRTQVVLPDKRPLPSMVTDLAAAAAAAASRQDKAAGGPQPAGPPPLPAAVPDSAFLPAFLGRTLDRWNHEALLRGLYCCLRVHGRRRGVGVALDAVRGWEGEAFHTTINYVWIQLLTAALANEYSGALFSDRPTGLSSTDEQQPAGDAPAPAATAAGAGPSSSRPLPEWSTLLAAGGYTAVRLQELLADPRRYLRHYSDKLVFSERAAREFVPPDKKPLPTTVG